MGKKGVYPHVRIVEQEKMFHTRIAKSGPIFKLSCHIKKMSYFRPKWFAKIWPMAMPKLSESGIYQYIWSYQCGHTNMK